MDRDSDTMLDVYMTREQREAYERLRKDAERYRQLRDGSDDDFEVRRWVSITTEHGIDSVQELLAGADLDDAIDGSLQGANA